MFVAILSEERLAILLLCFEQKLFFGGKVMDTLAKGRATVLHVVTLPTIPSDSFDGEIGISRSNFTQDVNEIKKRSSAKR